MMPRPSFLLGLEHFSQRLGVSSSELRAQFILHRLTAAAKFRHPQRLWPLFISFQLSGTGSPRNTFSASLVTCLPNFRCTPLPPPWVVNHQSLIRLRWLGYQHTTVPAIRASFIWAETESCSSTLTKSDCESPFPLPPPWDVSPPLNRPRTWTFFSSDRDNHWDSDVDRGKSTPPTPCELIVDSAN